MFFWIVIVGGISSFIAAMGIGSNDAANAFATSVGSKALTIKQASILAVVFETSGAVLMGSHVTDTIRKGIANYQCFEQEPYLLMYGCMGYYISIFLVIFSKLFRNACFYNSFMCRWNDWYDYCYCRK